MPGDRIAVLADSHLSRDDPERVEQLARALEQLGESCAAVYVLGDLFEVWLGVRTVEPHVARVAGALRELRARGVRTGYVEGNRDFGIGRGVTGGLFDAVAPRELVERFGGLTYHFSHGDLVNPRDRQYRAWRAVSKGLLAPVGLRLLPDALAIALAARLERRLAATNLRHKSYFPEADCVAYARARVAAGADVVVVGHFHRHAVIPVEAAGRRGLFVALPFWHAEPRPVFFDLEGRVIV